MEKPFKDMSPSIIKPSKEKLAMPKATKKLISHMKIDKKPVMKPMKPAPMLGTPRKKEF